MMKSDTESKKSAKLKPLSPSLRIKTRYLVFEVLHPKDNFNYLKAIQDECKDLYGKVGFAAMDFRKIEVKDHKGIIMINRKSVDKLKSTFIFINNKEKIGIVSRFVSGSLKKAKTYL